MTILLSHIQILAAIPLDVSSVLMVVVIFIAFVITWAVNRISLLRIRQGVDKIKETSAIMQHTLDMGKNYVLMLDIRQQHAVNIHGRLLPDSGMEDRMCLTNFGLLKEKDTVKFVAGSIRDLERAKEIIERYGLIGRCHIYLSPVFGRIQPADMVEFMIRHKLNGVRLQLQLHKFIWHPDTRGV